jgi:hypothetical protein
MLQLSDVCRAEETFEKRGQGGWMRMNRRDGGDCLQCEYQEGSVVA